MKIRILKRTDILGIECDANDVVDVADAVAGPLIAEGAADKTPEAVAYAEDEYGQAIKIEKATLAAARTTAAGGPQRPVTAKSLRAE